MYEYSTINGSVEFPNTFKSLSNDKIGTRITSEFGKMLSEFPLESQKLNGGGWEIVSHSLCLLENHLVISLLLRRPSQ